MGKMIAIWGSPNSGKTTFAVKIASTIYERYNSRVIVVSCDDTIPALPLLFPNLKSKDLLSIGASLSKVEITQQEIVKNIIIPKNKKNFGFLGYKDGENRFSYPALDDVKAVGFFETLKSLADFVVIDCTSILDNTLSGVALQKSDDVICLSSPTLKSISFFTSQLPLYDEPKYRLDRHIMGLNITESECYMPIEEVRSHFKEVAFTLPYCRKIRQQDIDGELLRPISDKKFTSKLIAIADKLI